MLAVLLYETSNPKGTSCPLGIFTQRDELINALEDRMNTLISWGHLTDPTGQKEVMTAIGMRDIDKMLDVTERWLMTEIVMWTFKVNDPNVNASGWHVAAPTTQPGAQPGMGGPQAPPNPGAPAGNPYAGAIGKAVKAVGKSSFPLNLKPFTLKIPMSDPGDEKATDPGVPEEEVEGTFDPWSG